MNDVEALVKTIAVQGRYIAQLEAQFNEAQQVIGMLQERLAMLEPDPEAAEAVDEPALSLVPDTDED